MGDCFCDGRTSQGIKKNEEEARKQPLPKQQMTLQEIDSILTEAFLSRKAVIIQLNLKDEFGRLLDEVEGHFIGEAYEDYFMIDHQPILWEDVRYIELKETKKWFVT